MSSDSFQQLLDRAASCYGIDGGFWDIFGQHHTTSAQAKQAILRALGVGADSAEDLESGLARLSREEWQRVLPPVVVAVAGVAVEVPLQLPVDRLGVRAQFTVRHESGEVGRFDCNLWE